ncbi:MAG: helix-turn-helix domain-containing protein [Clostridiaceae bacterium]|jgi:repressor LexA|nr:helix-turn-helix domain-containing protein [Clostridiaceae bacterium]
MTNRIAELRKGIKMTQAHLATKLGVAGNTLSQYETGKRNMPDALKHKIADMFKVSVDYIIGRAELSESGENRPDNFPEYSRLPVYDKIKGNPYTNSTDAGETQVWDCADAVYDKTTHFFLRVDGDGMEPTIPAGSLVIIRVQDHAEKGDIVAFRMDDDYVRLKRYFPQNNDRVLLRGDNPDSESYVVTLRQLDIKEAGIIGIACEARFKIRRKK